jgi:hypothetical protein
MRRLLQLGALFSALVWAGMLLWARQQPETETRAPVRTASFCLMFASALLMPTRRRLEGEPPEEETF